MVAELRVRLFGRVSVERHGQALAGFSASKVQELFSYLLLHRGRPHPREALASLLWGESPTVHSKKYLRQALWQLQGALRYECDPGGGRLLLIDADWVQLNAAAGLWLDVADFERASALAQGVPAEFLDAGIVNALQTAVGLYQGDLLEGWYQNWCLRERDRLQDVLLGILDKLMGHCESHELFDAGLQYGVLSLRHDPARECTHQRLMRLQYLAGDRAAALRQYDRCAVALDGELGVKPSEVTVALYQQISEGRLRAPSPAASGAGGATPGEATAFADVLGRLRHLEVVLAGMQHQLHTDIRAVETVLSRRAGPDGVERRPPVRSVPRSRIPGRGQKPAARG